MQPATLLECVQRLHAKGFASDEFHTDVARCLGAVAKRDAGLDCRTCKLIESWITEVDEDKQGIASSRDDSEAESTDAASHSLLWNIGGFRPLPHGNYPLLEALALGYLCRSPVDAECFLDVVERHLGRREHAEVWVAMMSFLIHLDRADPKRRAAFIDSLLDSHPDAFLDAWAVRFVVSSVSWMPDAMLDRIFDLWTSGDWALGPQAAGEVAAVVLCRRQHDAHALKRVEQYLGDSDQSLESRESLKIGLAHTFIEALCEADVRPFAVPYLLRIIASADARIASALHRLYWDERAMRPDEYSERVLDACLANPLALDIDSDSALVSRLKSLVEWNPSLAAKAAFAYLDAKARPSGGDSPTYVDDELVDVALTLHHMPETRVAGLDLFERLLTLPAYGIPKRLATLDRHAP